MYINIYINNNIHICRKILQEILHCNKFKNSGNNLQFVQSISNPQEYQHWLNIRNNLRLQSQQTGSYQYM